VLKTLNTLPKPFMGIETLWEIALSLIRHLTVKDEFYPQRLTHYHEIFMVITHRNKDWRTTPKNGSQQF